jgi:hypothetical protein
MQERKLFRVSSEKWDVTKVDGHPTWIDAYGTQPQRMVRQTGANWTLSPLSLFPLTRLSEVGANIEQSVVHLPRKIKSGVSHVSIIGVAELQLLKTLLRPFDDSFDLPGNFFR